MNKVTMRPAIYIGWMTIVASGCAGMVDAPDEGLSTPVVAVCSSKTSWKPEDKVSDLMNPGLACNDCHQKTKGPVYTAVGTIYPTLHEPNDCNGVNGIAPPVDEGDPPIPVPQIVITDGEGRMLPPVSINSVGNFHYSIPIIAPFHVKVVYKGKESVMKDAVQSPDCNTCHTQFGQSGAAGRVTVPE